ncbi:MAG: hypothetical protein WC794_03605 [Candidatus Doudnabacteria bacterium]|jgi:hypothetical protein
MKKILLAVGLVALVAAGCNSAKPEAINAPDAGQGTQKEIQKSGSAPEGMAQSSVAASKVTGVDDAVNLLEAHSSSEKDIVAGTDDSDLTSSDSAELNSMTEVPNAQ